MSDAEIARRRAIRLAFGHAVREARTQAGLSQEALAERSELSRPTIARIELGTTSPAIDRLWAIAEALDLTPDDLVRRVDI